MLKSPDDRQIRAAVFGIGGVGKTQLLLKFATDYKLSYQYIFYISAHSREKVVGDLCRLAHLSPLSNTCFGQTLSEQTTAVISWFNQTKNWLLIFDNVNDVRMIREFIPSCSHGHVLFTTRDESIAFDLVNDDQEGVVELLPLTDDDSVELILRVSDVARTPASVEAANGISAVLKGLPVALEQVASASRRLKTNLSENLKQLKLQKSVNLSTHHPTSRYENESTTAMVQIALKDANLRSPHAGFVFELMCIFGQEYMLKRFLTGEYEKLPELTTAYEKTSTPRKRDVLKGIFRPKAKSISREQSSTCGAVFEDQPDVYTFLCDQNKMEVAFEALKSVGLIRHLDEKTFWSHDLVREVVLDGITPARMEELTKLAVQISARSFPRRANDNAQECRAYIPFVLASVKRFKDCVGERTLPYWLCKNVTNYYFHQALFEEMANWANTLEKIVHYGYDYQSYETIQSRHNKAISLRHLGKFEDSLKAYEEILALLESDNSIRPSGSFASIQQVKGNMSIVLRELGRNEEALVCQKERIAFIEQSSGKTNVYFKALRNLGALYEYDRDYDMALKCYKECLEGQTKLIGQDQSIDIGKTLEGIGNAYANQKEFEKAIDFLKRAREEYVAMYGINHPYVTDLQDFINITEQDIKNKSSGS